MNATDEDTRASHLAWCKQRATEYVQAGDLANAITSMISDLPKHPSWSASPVIPTMMMIGMMDAGRGDRAAVQRWIDGWH